MAVTLYRATDGGAPQLTGAAGTLIAVLRQCLVSGYGSKSPAGWSQIFSLNNVAGFKQGGGCGFTLQIHDNGESSVSYREARASGWETLTTTDSGTGQFPTSAQMANGALIRKSATLDTTTRDWILVADEKRFHLLIATGDWSARRSGFFFGDIQPLRAGGDPYCCALIGRSVEGNTESYDIYSAVNQMASTAAQAASFLARSFTGQGSSQQFGKIGDYSMSGQAVMGASGYLAYPEPVSNGPILSPLGVVQGGGLRGWIPGLWAPQHSLTSLTAAFSDGDTITMGGKSFMFAALAQAGCAFIEISSTW